MSFARRLKRQVRAAVAPSVFLCLVGYFLYQATQGEHGLQSYDKRQQDLIAAQAELQRANLDLSAWEARVGSLQGAHLDPDAVDERSRAMLNLSDPGDIIIPYPAGKRLF